MTRQPAVSVGCSPTVKRTSGAQQGKGGRWKGAKASEETGLALDLELEARGERVSHQAWSRAHRVVPWPGGRPA